MTPEETASATAPGISQIASHFMLDAATYARGAKLGFAGMDFYVTGRCGTLGAVDGDAVVEALTFFEPGMVRQSWQTGTAVMEPDEAAATWAAVAHEWAETHVPDDLDAARLADLATTVVEAGAGADAPVFEGWRKLPVPSSPKARALHHLNGLRELRGGLHATATRAAGLGPRDAVLVRTPHMAPLFGWPEPYPDVDDQRGLWQEAEDATDRAMAPAFSTLADAERDELASLIDRLHRATSA